MTGVRYTQSADGIGRITLRRPEKHNALDSETIRGVTEHATAAAGSARALILASEGESFCAGADLGWMREQFEAPPEQRAAEAGALQTMLAALDSFPGLVIGLVQGPAYGGGVGLVSVCDVVIAGPRASFALTETRLGLIPAVIAPFLHRRIGAASLRAIGLDGTVLDTARALSLGLVSESVAADGLEAAAARHAQRVLGCAPGAVAEAKALFRALGSGADADVVSALAARWQSEEARAGISAFLRKETPPWRT